MKIMDSNISFSSSRNYKEKQISKQKVEAWVDPPVSPASVSVSIDKNSIKKAGSAALLFSAYTDIDDISSDSTETFSDPKLATMKRVLEAITGRKIKITDMSKFKSEHDAAPQSMIQKPISEENSPEKLGWGVTVSTFQSYYESEQTQVNTKGIIHTEDGQEINFSLHLNMKREFYSEETSVFQAGDALLDPLIVNFTGHAAEFTDTKFQFDLNSDGDKEDIPWLAPGSGFLVFDKNHDGIVNNGKELFGPKTGFGFAELAKFDTDGNNWIDENDQDFNKLSVWSGNSGETSFLTSLKDAGIGAISLANTKTDFTIKDQSNSTLGKIRNTGIYLHENGKAGTIQHIDLAV